MAFSSGVYTLKLNALSQNNTLIKNASGFRNSGYNNTYSFHCLVRLAFPHLHKISWHLSYCIVRLHDCIVVLTSRCLGSKKTCIETNCDKKSMPAMSISAARLVCLDSENAFLGWGTSYFTPPPYCSKNRRLLIAHRYFISQLHKTQGLEVSTSAE